MSTGTKKKKLETLIIKGVSTLSFFSASSEIVTRGTGGPGQIPVTTSQKTDIDGARQTFSSLWENMRYGKNGRYFSSAPILQVYKARKNDWWTLKYSLFFKTAEMEWILT